MDIVIRKLEQRASLSREEKAALRLAFEEVRIFRDRENVMVEGARPAFVGALLTGLVARNKALPGGGRQILAFSLPGDIFDLQSFLLERMDHGVTALCRSKVAIAPRPALRDLAESHPRLGRLLWRETLVEGSVFRDWIVNCGRRTAYQRVAHLLCEVFVRMAQVGLTDGKDCFLPLTQAELGDATGLSLVHVNRVLRQLRDHGFASVKGGRMTVGDWQGLTEAGVFDPAYLHLGSGFVEPWGLYPGA